MRKIKGGLLVDIGVPVFLPASQVDIRRPATSASSSAAPSAPKILKIDRAAQHRHLRRKLIEEERERGEEAAVRDRGGPDIARARSRTSPTSARSSTSAASTACCTSPTCPGAASTTRPRWSRSTRDRGQGPQHRPREGEDRAGPQAEGSPARGRDRAAYPVGAARHGRGRQPHVLRRVRQARGRHRGPGAHLRDVVDPPHQPPVGDGQRRRQVEVVVLDIDKDKQEISLGMKQTEVNPWELVAEKYPPGTDHRGRGPQPRPTTARSSRSSPASTACCTSPTCRGPRRSRTRQRGAQEGRRRRVRRPLKVDQEKQRIALGRQAAHRGSVARGDPGSLQPGHDRPGKVTKITNFGVFVELEDDLEGLLHISELADHKVENPQDVVKIGEKIEVKILRVDTTSGRSASRSGRNGPRSSVRRRASRRRSSSVAAGCTVPVSRLPV
jgi:small subunit ribosomal protein S1